MSQPKKFMLYPQGDGFRVIPNVLGNKYFSNIVHCVDRESVLIHLKEAVSALKNECWCSRGDGHGDCDPCSVNIYLMSFIKELENV